MHQVVVDHTERNAPLCQQLGDSGQFSVTVGRLPTGDYLINDAILVERKTETDFMVSLIDGRLFPQVARLAQSRYRSLMLIEGPLRAGAPDVHPHAVEGALVSIAVMWRLPVLHSSDAGQSCRLLRLLAGQGSSSRHMALRRFDRKPKRLATRRLFVLQGLPGIGPALARRLLSELGSVGRVMSADASALERVHGLGPKKAARIRELVDG